MKTFRSVLALVALAASSLASSAEITVPLARAPDGRSIVVTPAVLVDSTGAEASLGGGTDGVAQNSTTSGQSGVLSQGATTTSAPTYTTAKTNPLSLDTAGNLRVKDTATATSTASIDTKATTANTSLSDIAASVAALEDKVDTLILNIGDPTDTAAANGTVTGSIFAFAKASLIAAQDTTPTPISINQTTTANDVDVVTSALPTGAATQTTLSAIDTKLAGTLTVSSTSTSGTPIVPATATATTGTLLGGQYNSTLPTFTDGQQGALRSGSRGSLNIQIISADGTIGAVSKLGADGVAANSGSLMVLSTPMTYDSGGSALNRAKQVADGVNTIGTGIPAAGLYAQCDDTSPSATTEGNYSNVRVSCTNHALIIRPYESQANSWSYAAASGGISNTTTAVTIKAAAAAGLKNCTLSLQLSAPTLGAATEVAIRDGAGGTVLWRGYMSTAGGNQSAAFSPPICGTAATLTEIVTLTATVTGAVYANAQGYIAP